MGITRVSRGIIWVSWGSDGYHEVSSVSRGIGYLSQGSNWDSEVSGGHHEVSDGYHNVAMCIVRNQMGIKN